MMSKARINGIKDLLDQKRAITQKEIITIRDCLLESVQWPVFETHMPLRLKTETAMTLAVNEFALPLLDLYNGVVKNLPPERASPPLVASFPGASGPNFVPARFVPEKPAIECSVPADAVGGVLKLLVPVSEHYGSQLELERLASSLDIDLAAVTRSAHELDVCPPFPWPPSPLGELIKWKWMIAAEAAVHTQYKEIEVGLVEIGCSTCVVGCPYGAIVLDPYGRCSVNTDECLGQRFRIDRTQFEFTPDGRQIYKRFEEQPCWECFVGQEQYSEKCPRGVLRKALHHNGVCCASCGPASRVAGPNLMELCPHDAITNQNWIFVANKDKCTGCMTCYLGINCANNVEAGEPLCCSGGCPSNTEGNYTIRMVAYSDHATT